MTEQALTVNTSNAIEQVVVLGDLSKLTPEQRTVYYKQVCLSLGLNSLTRPFSYIVLNGKLTLYANKDCSEQLRKKNGVSIYKLERATEDGICIVTAYAKDKTGRTDSSIGAVSVEGLKGDARANAYMKTETKAKRRVTLSICGLGMLDESEIETIPDAQPVASETVEPQVQHVEQKQATATTTRPPTTTTPNGNTKPEDAKARLLKHKQEAIEMVSSLSAKGFEDEAGKLDKLIKAANLAIERNASIGAMHSHADALKINVADYKALLKSVDKDQLEPESATEGVTF